MIRFGKGAERAVEDFMLTRYACYLIAQNGDPRKEAIAFAHIAALTRISELKVGIPMTMEDRRGEYTQENSKIGNLAKPAS